MTYEQIYLKTKLNMPVRSHDASGSKSISSYFDEISGRRIEFAKNH